MDMKRIMLYILGFLIYGIIIAYFNISYLFVLPAFAVCIIIYRCFKIKWIFCFVLISVLGIALTEHSKSIMNVDNEILSANDDILSEVRVKQIEKTKAGKNYYILSSEKFIIKQKEIDKKLNMLFYTNSEDKLEIGQKAEIKAKIFEMEQNTNFYGFDSYNYYSARKISLSSYGDIVFKRETKKDLYFYIYSLRDRISNVYDDILPAGYSSIAKAMVLGDKSEIDAELANRYTIAGIYHILAISGLHICAICLFLVFLTDRIHIRYAKPIAVLILFLYALMTGGSPSAMRAVIMASVMLLRYIFLRSEDFLTSAAFSAVVILCISPMMLFDIGFQYSFGAIFTIGFIVVPAVKFIKKGRLFSWCFSCVIISTFLKVITAYYFYGISNVDIFLNIIILPFMSFIVISALLGGAAGVFWLDAGRFFAAVFYIGWRFINFISEKFIKMPFSYIITGRLNFIVVIGFLIFFFLLSFSLYENKKVFKRRFVFFMASLIVLASSMAVDIIQRIISERELEITFIDVGQGDSAYGRYNGFNFLIDGGGTGGGSIGKNNINARGSSRLNAVFVSHTDEDHVKGIIEIMDLIYIDSIYISAVNPQNEYFDELLKTAHKKNIPVYKMKDGDYISYKGLKISCIYPLGNENADINNSSMVLRAELGEKSFLFTGDIEKQAEDEILKSGKNIDCDVIKIAHHGSSTSSSDEFLIKASPEAAIISVGKNNLYSHPAKDVVKRIKNSGAELLSTAERGDVIIKTNGRSLNIKTRR